MALKFHGPTWASFNSNCFKNEMPEDLYFKARRWNFNPEGLRSICRNRNCGKPPASNSAITRLCDISPPLCSAVRQCASPNPSGLSQEAVMATPTSPPAKESNNQLPPKRHHLRPHSVRLRRGHSPGFRARHPAVPESRAQSPDRCHRRRNLLSGLLVCATCGAPSVTCGNGRGVCSNHNSIRKPRI